MANELKQYFPLLRERKEVLQEIQDHEELLSVFESWTEEYQEEFLDFCTGVKGVKMLYDSFFKEIMNPEIAPKRMNHFLSVILGEKVKILKVLPNDSIRIADESSLLITDIVVEMEDGSIANVEAQKIGYAFPGQRCACYSADLLLRQYKRIRAEKSERRKRFNYKDIKKVYTIVLFEKSSREFHRYPDNYVHYMKQKSDTGLELDMLQEFILLPLDIYLKNLHNRGISNELDAWLAFFSTDDPEYIAYLCEHYPMFREMYEDVYELCRNVEQVINMFSKELMEFDQGTVQYMIDEMQDTIDEQKDTIDEQKNMIDEQKNMIDEQKNMIDEQKGMLEGQKKLLDEQKELIEGQQMVLEKLKAEVEQLKKQLNEHK